MTATEQMLWAWAENNLYGVTVQGVHKTYQAARHDAFAVDEFYWGRATKEGYMLLRLPVSLAKGGTRLSAAEVKLGQQVADAAMRALTPAERRIGRPTKAELDACDHDVC